MIRGKEREIYRNSGGKDPADLFNLTQNLKESTMRQEHGKNAAPAEKHAASPQETKIVLADPTALGVFGLSMVTFVASFQKLGMTEGVTYLIPWALMLGCCAQLIGSIIDFFRNNIFGAVVLGAFGLFWVAVSTHWMISIGWFGPSAEGAADVSQIGYAFLGYFIFSVFVTVAALEVSKVFGIMLVLIDILLLGLALSSLGVAPHETKMIAGLAELGTALIGFYATGGLFLNGFFKRTILPMGKPFGFIRKG